MRLVIEHDCFVGGEEGQVLYMFPGGLSSHRCQIQRQLEKLVNSAFPVYTVIDLPLYYREIFIVISQYNNVFVNFSCNSPRYLSYFETVLTIQIWNYVPGDLVLLPLEVSLFISSNTALETYCADTSKVIPFCCCCW